MNPFRPSVRLAQALDVVLVVVFVLIGRVSHKEDLSLVGIAVTLWPFLVGLVLGWLVTRSWRAPIRLLWNGVAIWVITVLVAMFLRAITGQGVELSFVAVAAGVLAVFLLGWRAIALLITRKGHRATAA